MALLRSAATVGGLTAISRALGFLRDMLVASVMGTGPVGQAFVIAFRVPSMFRTFFAEGAFNSAFVPMFARRLEADGLVSAKGLAEQVFAVLFFWLLLLTALAQIAMPLLVQVIAPGFTGDPEKFDLSVALTRIAFPYVLFMTLTAVLGGILNSLRKFAVAAAAPVVLNILMIATLLWMRVFGAGNSVTSGYALVWSMCLAGVLQFILLALACRRVDIGLALRRPLITQDVRDLFRLAVPGLIAGGITQVNLLISTMVATGIDRAVSQLYFAERLYQLPLGVIGVAIGIVLLPDMSRRLRAGDVAGALGNQNRALEFAMFVTLPITVTFTVIPVALISTFFEHGAFTAADTSATASALAAFTLGLPAYTLYKIFAPGFFARANTRTPMVFALIAVAFNIAGSLTLPAYMGHVGLALSTAMAAWVNTGLLAFTLFRNGHYAIDARLKRNLPLTIISSMIMGGALFAAASFAWPVFEHQSDNLLRGLALLGLVGFGSTVYLLSAHLTGAMPWRDLRKMIRRT